MFEEDLMEIVNRNPLVVILSTGLLFFLFSTGVTYYWASRSPAQATKPQYSEKNPPGETSSSIESEEGFDTGQLSAGDWESFLDYEGKRFTMLGIKKEYARTVVNFRAGPGTDYDVVATPSGGDLVVRMDRFNDWYRGRLRNGQLGWIHDSLVRILEVPEPVFNRFRENLPSLKKSTLATVPNSFFDQNRLKVTRRVVNLRRGPGTQFKIVGRAYRYERLRILAKQRRWFRVVSPSGFEAWVREDLVEPVWVTEPEKRPGLVLVDARVRFGPRYQFREQRVLSDTTTVEQIEREEAWHMIQLEDGTIGWVHEEEVIRSHPARTE